MPWDKAAYPSAWKAIRAAVLARAHGRCEGTPLHPDCDAHNYDAHPETGSLVILTTAHLCRCEPKCGELSHLRMLCQRCHLSLDRTIHVLRAAETRRKQKEALGQLTFLA